MRASSTLSLIIKLIKRVANQKLDIIKDKVDSIGVKLSIKNKGEGGGANLKDKIKIIVVVGLTSKGVRLSIKEVERVRIQYIMASRYKLKDGDKGKYIVNIYSLSYKLVGRINRALITFRGFKGRVSNILAN